MGIYVWGTGCGASELLERGLGLERISGFVDSFLGGSTFLGKPVLLPQQLDIGTCDLLIFSARHAEPIAQRCRELGIPAEKCLYLKNNCTLQDRHSGCGAAETVLGKELLNRLIPKQRLVTTPAQ